MERKMIDFTIKQLKCIPNGSKEACVKVREYLQNMKIDSKNRIQCVEYSSVKSAEFIEAVKVLMAFAWENRENDKVPDRWYCESDCANNDTCIFCPGEYQVVPQDKENQKVKRCPYYREWDQ